MQVVFSERGKMFVCKEEYNALNGTCIRYYILVLDLCDLNILAMKVFFMMRKVPNQTKGMEKIT